MNRRRGRGDAVAVLFLAGALAACGAGSGGDGETVLTGLVVVPESGCRGCRNGEQFVRVQALQEDGPPLTIKCVRTTPRGVYDTRDESLCASETTFQAAADGDQTVIVVVDVEPSTGAQIGGVLAAPIGTTKSKDFNGTTQIACVASVYLTAGNEDASAGCVVQPSCPAAIVDGVPCFPTIDPNAIRDDQIENLEAASSFVSTRIDYPGGVPRAVCAVIECTASGTQPASAECVQSRL